MCIIYVDSFKILVPHDMVVIWYRKGLSSTRPAVLMRLSIYHVSSPSSGVYLSVYSAVLTPALPLPSLACVFVVPGLPATRDVFDLGSAFVRCGARPPTVPPARPCRHPQSRDRSGGPAPGAVGVDTAVDGAPSCAPGPSDAQLPVGRSQPPPSWGGHNLGAALR